MRLRAVLFLLLPWLALAAPAVAQGDPSFNLVNRSGQPINEIYVSPVREPNWGRDLLGTEVLPDGRAFPVRIASSAGCRQDVRVVYADGRPEERRGVDTCAIAEMVFGAAAAPAPQGAGGNPSFNLVNRGATAIREIYVSSARETHWGEDRLGAEVLPPGRHVAVRLPVGDCLNDVRVVWADGRREDRRQVDTCRLVNMVFQ
ncbi:hypothetical protein [Falsiroseomonas sp. CW058]|uniref:hypothetical protein n=1 Tax=Falsiroseomonas sp. CW058 TaxID=3388664 RepID=UPI003D31D88D